MAAVRVLLRRWRVRLIFTNFNNKFIMRVLQSSQIQSGLASPSAAHQHHPTHTSSSKEQAHKLEQYFKARPLPEGQRLRARQFMPQNSCDVLYQPEDTSIRSKVHIRALCPNTYIQKLRILYFLLLTETYQQLGSHSQADPAVDNRAASALENDMERQNRVQRVQRQNWQHALERFKILIYLESKVPQFRKKLLAEFMQLLEGQTKPRPPSNSPNAVIALLNKYPIMDEIFIDSAMIFVQAQQEREDSSVDDNFVIRQFLRQYLNLECTFTSNWEYNLNGVNVSIGNDCFSVDYDDHGYFKEILQSLGRHGLDVSRVGGFDERVFDRLDQSYINDLGEVMSLSESRDSRFNLHLDDSRLEVEKPEENKKSCFNEGSMRPDHMPETLQVYKSMPKTNVSQVSAKLQSSFHEIMREQFKQAQPAKATLIAPSQPAGQPQTLSFLKHRLDLPAESSKLATTASVSTLKPYQFKTKQFQHINTPKTPQTYTPTGNSSLHGPPFIPLVEAVKPSNSNYHHIRQRVSSQPIGAAMTGGGSGFKVGEANSDGKGLFSRDEGKEGERGGKKAEKSLDEVYKNINDIIANINRDIKRNESAMDINRFRPNNMTEGEKVMNAQRLTKKSYDNMEFKQNLPTQQGFNYNLKVEGPSKMSNSSEYPQELKYKPQNKPYINLVENSSGPRPAQPSSLYSERALHSQTSKQAPNFPGLSRPVEKSFNTNHSNPQMEDRRPRNQGYQAPPYQKPQLVQKSFGVAHKHSFEPPQPPIFANRKPISMDAQLNPPFNPAPMGLPPRSQPERRFEPIHPQPPAFNRPYMQQPLPVNNWKRY